MNPLDQIRAMRAGPELNDLAATVVMGWRWTGLTNKRNNYDYRDELFEPSTRIEHAWELVDRLRKDGWHFQFSTDKETTVARFSRSTARVQAFGDDAEALTRAAILAKMGER